MFLVDKRVFPAKNLLLFVLGDTGGEEVPLKADAGTTRLLDDCFQRVKGERDNFLSSIRLAASEVELVLPFSTMTNPPLLLSSE